MKRFALGLAVLAACALPATSTYAQQKPAACQFILGFKTLHDLDPTDIGDCKDNQAFAGNGDAQQHTAKGLMAWRKADNWTAFTNGYKTWINGPSGLVSRLNTERYSWEGDASAPGIKVIGAAPAAAKPAAPAPAAAAPAPAPAPATADANTAGWAVTFDRAVPVASMPATDGSGQAETPQGRFVRFFLKVKNVQGDSSVITADDFTLVDDGVKYGSDFPVEQVKPDGSVAPVDEIEVAPNATVALSVVIDVPLDVTSGTLSTDGGNDLPNLKL